MGWILTHSGKKVDLLEPKPEMFDIRDIARGLANTCRFGGHTLRYYSVAQHSVLASRHVQQAFAFDALMHDAAEAYLGDVTAPLKALLPDYKAIEARFEAALFSHFGVGYPLSGYVKHIDRVLLATERRDLMPANDDEWPELGGVVPLGRSIRPMGAELAEKVFLQRFEELKRRRV